MKRYSCMSILWALLLLPVAVHAQVGGPGTVVVGGGSSATGTIGGSTGATDNVPLCADGTGGSTLGACTAAVFPAGTAALPSVTWTTTTDGIYYDNNGPVGLAFAAGTTPSLKMVQGQAIFVSNGVLSWGNQVNTFASSTADTGLKKQAAGVVRATDGASGYGAFISGRLVEANVAGSGAPNVLVGTESGTVLTNEGVTAENYHTLPSAVAGYEFTFIVQDTDGIRITAAAGDTIRPIAGTAASSAAGFIRCATAGAFIRLQAINATEWIATGSAGTWTIDI